MFEFYYARASEKDYLGLIKDDFETDEFKTGLGQRFHNFKLIVASWILRGLTVVRIQMREWFTGYIGAIRFLQFSSKVTGLWLFISFKFKPRWNFCGEDPTITLYFWGHESYCERNSSIIDSNYNQGDFDFITQHLFHGAKDDYHTHENFQFWTSIKVKAYMSSINYVFLSLSMMMK